MEGFPGSKQEILLQDRGSTGSKQNPSRGAPCPVAVPLKSAEIEYLRICPDCIHHRLEFFSHIRILRGHIIILMHIL